MTHGSLFSGIGGFDLAAEWMGWDNIFHCEWNEFGQKVLKYYWPKSISYADITKTDFTIHRGRIDILTGGFPCQPYSTAGKRLGKEDERHLWPEMLRAIREIKPRWIVGENVLGLVSWNGGLVFEEVQSDLEAEGYEVQAYILPAAGVNAPHQRYRIWFVAFKNSYKNGWGCFEWEKKAGIWEQWDSCTGDNEWLRTNDDKAWITPNTNGIGLERIGSEKCGKKSKWIEKTKRFNNRFFSYNRKEYNRPDNWKNFPTQSAICNGDDGIPERLDSITFPKWRTESIKAGGNAIVPQVAHQIFKAIHNYESQTKLF